MYRESERIGTSRRMRAAQIAKKGNAGDVVLWTLRGGTSIRGFNMIGGDSNSFGDNQK